MATKENVSEIKSWLEVALKEEKLKELSVEIEGNSEKGDGYLGDIVFVTANGITDHGIPKKYDLVLKCSKRSKALRETTQVQQIFLNEIFQFTKVLPRFIEFQKSHGIEDVFDNVAKCYGYFTSDEMEVLVLENMKKLGYGLWPKKTPLTRKHIDLVIKKYGQLHATSIAFKEQNPTDFQEIVHFVSNVFKTDENRTSDNEDFFGGHIDEAYAVLRDDFDDNVLSKWLSLKQQIKYIIDDIPKNIEGIKVISHGDCWNNNFMYIYKKEEPLNVVFLDWQISLYTTPITDLSYFLFCNTAERDFENMENILKTYHKSFTDHLRNLNIKNPEDLYPFDQLIKDWKNYCKRGILMSSLIMKVCSTEKDEVRDLAEMAESGKGFKDTFQNEIRDKETYRKRMRPIVEYAIKHNLI